MCGGRGGPFVVFVDRRPFSIGRAEGGRERGRGLRFSYSFPEDKIVPRSPSSLVHLVSSSPLYGVFDNCWSWTGGRTSTAPGCTARWIMGEGTPLREKFVAPWNIMLVCCFLPYRQKKCECAGLGLRDDDCIFCVVGGRPINCGRTSL